MALTIKHTKVSTIPDGSDPSLVLPSDWNADHSFTGSIDVPQGGTGTNTLTGIVKGNGTSPMTAATGPEIVAAIGGTKVANAINADIAASLNGTLAINKGGTGATTAADARTALGVPATDGTGATGNWGINIQGTADKASNLASGSGSENRIPVQAAPSVTNFINAPTASGQVLTYNGTTIDWATGGGGGGLLGVTQNVSPFETALGFEAGNANTGVNNTYLGYQAGRACTGATNNVAIGFQALDVATIPSSNVVIGSGACGSTTGSSQNVVIGNGAAGATTLIGADCVIIGNDAGRTVQGTSNILIGSSSGNNVTTGTQMVGIGVGCFGTATAAAAGAVAVGNNALGGLTTGARNTAVGGQSGAALLTGNDNTFLGFDTGKLATGNENTFIGSLAGDAVVGGVANVCVGYNSGTAVTTGNNNTFVGRNSGGVVTTGSNNTVIGNYAGQSATMSGFVILADGSGNQRMTVNNNGAVTFNNAVDFGTDGFVLQTRGNAQEPRWVNPNVSSVAQFATNVSMLPSISVYFMNCTSGNLTATLPSASANVGLRITVKRVDQTANTLTVASVSGLIEGLATQSLGVSVAVQYCSDGLNWWELANS